MNNVKNVEELVQAIEREPNKKDAPYNKPNDFTITLEKYKRAWGKGQKSVSKIKLLHQGTRVLQVMELPVEIV